MMLANVAMVLAATAVDIAAPPQQVTVYSHDRKPLGSVTVTGATTALDVKKRVQAEFGPARVVALEALGLLYDVHAARVEDDTASAVGLGGQLYLELPNHVQLGDELIEELDREIEAGYSVSADVLLGEVSEARLVSFLNAYPFPDTIKGYADLTEAALRRGMAPAELQTTVARKYEEILQELREGRPESFLRNLIDQDAPPEVQEDARAFAAADDHSPERSAAARRFTIGAYRGIFRDHRDRGEGVPVWCLRLTRADVEVYKEWSADHGDVTKEEVPLASNDETHEEAAEEETHDQNPLHGQQATALASNDDQNLRETRREATEEETRDQNPLQEQQATGAEDAQDNPQEAPQEQPNAAGLSSTMLAVAVSVATIIAALL